MIGLSLSLSSGPLLFTTGEKLLKFPFTMRSTEEASEVRETIEEILKIIIDEWYEKVSNFYVTAEDLEADSSISEEEQLKRFHDEKGHRIKFSKDELDFTYGLRSYWEDESLHIEVSVNNKVEGFNVEGFKAKLAAHYRKAGREPVPTPYELKSWKFGEIFELDSNFDEAFKIELREGKADIMRLSFRFSSEALEKLVTRPVSSKELVESFCVTPFRNLYASVYRSA